jgi:hypothetical protein
VPTTTRTTTPLRSVTWTASPSRACGAGDATTSMGRKRWTRFGVDL